MGSGLGSRPRPSAIPTNGISMPQAMSARRQRSQQRAGEERARAAQHRAEALRLQQELERLQGHREQLEQHLRSLRVFGDFLQDVRAATGRVRVPVPKEGPGSILFIPSMLCSSFRTCHPCWPISGH